MSIAYRKLALLEKTLAEREEAARLQGSNLDYSAKEIRSKVTMAAEEVSDNKCFIIRDDNIDIKE